MSKRYEDIKEAVADLDEAIEFLGDYNTLGKLWSEKPSERWLAQLREKLINVRHGIENTCVENIKFNGDLFVSDPDKCIDKPGEIVAVRPCSEEYNPDGKTFYGILLGATRVHATIERSEDLKTLTITPTGNNPAIWVPDLSRVVRGIESWWHIIESEDELKEITTDDINSVWYVQALKAMAKREQEKKKNNEEE